MPLGSETTDFAESPPHPSLSQAQPNPQHQETSIMDGSTTIRESDPRRNTLAVNMTPMRKGTLKKRQSLSRQNSVKKGMSSMGGHPGSVTSLTSADELRSSNEDLNSAFYSPVPTRGSPTDILASRFQLWRRVLKDLIAYFRDIQKSYEVRSKALYSVSNVITNIVEPPELLARNGINDAILILRDYHKHSISKGDRAKMIEEEVIAQLTGLRSDLGQKIKEIKSLAGDFKNSVEKETELTRRAVQDLQEVLETASTESRSDPFLVRLAVDRQVTRQIDEENYLHRAFLNLESSGRELESIVVGEIQKAYNAYAGIMQREAENAFETVHSLRDGPLTIPQDLEWKHYVHKNPHFVDPRLPIRRASNIAYPCKDEPAASEVRVGMLERKSKYLKSYTPGWYVLSATHLHEFRSPDRIASQAPIMSLSLADQKLGSRSATDSTSHKFMLKGRQSGGLHRGHAWVFRAETYDTMMAWFSDIRSLTEKSGAERAAFIQRSHARSVSSSSHKAGSVSSDERALDEDEADAVPYSASVSQTGNTHPGQRSSKSKSPQRPNPGGRFPSALNVNHRDPRLPLEPSSPSSSGDKDVVAAASVLSGGNNTQGDENVNADGAGSLSARGCPNLYDSRMASTENFEPNNPDKQSHWYSNKMAPTAPLAKRSTGSFGDPQAYKPNHTQKSALHDREDVQPGLIPVVQPSSEVSKTGSLESQTKTADSGSRITYNVSGTLQAHRADPALPIRTMINAENPGDPIRELVRRPPLGTLESVATISELHVPGEFPKGQTNAGAS